MTTNIFLIGRTRYDLNPDATLPTDSNKSGNPNYKGIEMLEDPVNTSISGQYDDIIYISQILLLFFYSHHPCMF